MSIGIGLGLQLGRSRIGGAGAPASSEYWLDPAFDRRIAVEATNAQSIPLHDHIVDITVPAGIDSNSLRVAETTSLKTRDTAYGSRYARVGNVTPNHLPFLPCLLSGTTLTIKVLGKWAASEKRYFAIYWNSTGGVAALPYNHMGGIAQAWTLTPTVGTTGDSYVAVVTSNGVTQTATYVQQVGDTTATLLTTGIKAAINALGFGTIATGTSSATITQPTASDVTFNVVNTGSTQPSKVVVAKPLYFGVGRTGPDTEAFSTAAAYATGVPFSTSGNMTKPGWGRIANEGVRSMSYSVNGVGTKNLDGATVGTLTNNENSLVVTGTITDSNGKWSGSYTATLVTKIVAGRKSDIYPDDGTATLNKLVNCWHIVLTYTVIGAYTSTAIAAGATGNTNFDLLTLVNLDNVFTANVTENGAGTPQTTGTATQNAVPNFRANLATGVITAYTGIADNTAIGALAVPGTIFGSHGNGVGTGLLVNSISLNNFSPQAPTAFWQADSSSLPRLQLRNLTAASQIPLNATAVIDCWYIVGATPNTTATGDNLLPDEIVGVMQSLTGTAPTVSVAATETYVAGLAPTMALAGSRAVDGITWFQTNALTRTATATNYGYRYDTKLGTTVLHSGAPVDDHDANYGEAYKLAGLCLRYLRTGDASLVTLIENQVQFAINIEAKAVVDYGSFWSGSAPYWYWSTAAASTGLTAEGGLPDGDGAVDPLFGGALGTINYTQGQVRRKTSKDQISMVALGLYHYLYLLRNSAAITANTTLRTNALALLNRMKTFEAAHYTSAASVCGNLYDICNGGTPTNHNGITATEYNDSSGVLMSDAVNVAAQYTAWQVSDTDNTTADPSANESMDNFMRAVYAPGSVIAGVQTYMHGRARELLASDFGRHDTITSIAGAGTVTTYPTGWLPRALNTAWYRFTSGRTGDDHFLETKGGYRDAMTGRSAQRMAAIALSALMDPTYVVPIELSGGVTVVREVLITTALDDLARSIATYGIEPTTKAQRADTPYWLGVSSNTDPSVVDSAFTGYWMFATELWQLVHAGASYATYYPIGTW